MERVRAQWDFPGPEEGDLAFKKGDLITVIKKEDPNWWLGQLADGTEGIFPSNYVKPETSGPVRCKSVHFKSVSGESLKSVSIPVVEAGSDKKTNAVFTVEVQTDKGIRTTIKQYDDFKELNQEIKKMKKHLDMIKVKDLPSNLANIRDNLKKNTKQVLEKRRIMIEQYLQSLLQHSQLRGLLMTWFFPGEQVVSAVEPVEEENVDQVVATHDWDPKESCELALKAGQYVTVIKRCSTGWWVGKDDKGVKGIFPNTYVKEVEKKVLKRENSSNSEVGATTKALEAVSLKNASVANMSESKRKSLAAAPAHMAFVDKIEDILPADNQKPTPKKGSSDVPSTAKVIQKNGKETKVFPITFRDFTICNLDKYDEFMKNGFCLETMKTGSGAKPTPDQTIEIEYNINVWDGTQCRCYAAKATVKDKFMIGDGTAIPGLELAAQKMRPGQISNVIIQPELCFGTGDNENVPSDSTVIVTMKLVSVSGDSESKTVETESKSDHHRPGLASFGKQSSTRFGLQSGRESRVFLQL
eukprot:TRINITY_DN16182_c0_g1_i1.p1 TRINITY_DN16182_c0_g1~~TRINITY_DN16182_c0_g1_i1.p1  ORF type:complete len:527 (+),score=172.29 TRINITY_DN16182_c0_g1_i1:73-1653(+)